MVFWMRFVLRVLFRIRVEGEFPKDLGRTLIVANHESFLDGVLLALFLPMRPVFVVHSWVERFPWFKPF